MFSQLVLSTITFLKDIVNKPIGNNVATPRGWRGAMGLAIAIAIASCKQIAMSVSSL